MLQRVLNDCRRSRGHDRRALIVQALSTVRKFVVLRARVLYAVCPLPSRHLQQERLGYWSVRSYWRGEQARIDESRPAG